MDRGGRKCRDWHLETSSELWMLGEKLKGVSLLLEHYGLSKDEHEPFYGVVSIVRDLGEQVGSIAEALKSGTVIRSISPMMRING